MVHKLLVITAGTIAAGVGQSILRQMLEHLRSTLYTRPKKARPHSSCPVIKKQLDHWMLFHMILRWKGSNNRCKGRLVFLFSLELHQKFGEAQQRLFTNEIDDSYNLEETYSCLSQ